MTKMRSGFWPAVAGLASLIAVGTAGTVYALWAANASAGPLAVRQATVGLAVTKGADVVASAGGKAVGFTVGQAEAQALVDGGPDATGTFFVAVPFDVTMTSSPGYGIDYTLKSGAADSIFGLDSAKLTFVKVADSTQCTTTPVGDTYSSGQTVNGLASSVKDPQTAIDHWCLVISVTPKTYKNVATAAGTDSVGGNVTSSTDWMAYLLPDPTTQSALPITVTPTAIWGCEP